MMTRIYSNVCYISLPFSPVGVHVRKDKEARLAETSLLFDLHAFTRVFAFPRIMRTSAFATSRQSYIIGPTNVGSFI